MRCDNDDFIPCHIAELPADELVAAAADAIQINPANAPPLIPAAAVMFQGAGECTLEPQQIAVLTSKYWGAGGVDLTVGFMEQTSAELREKLLAYMNKAGGQHANIRFRWTQTDPQVRITREGSGYWSYLGTDVIRIPRNQPTMCLQGFSLGTRDSEYERVVIHETLHTCGCPHEHLRRQIVDRIDPAKAIAYFRQTQGWNESTTRSNVLTPLEERSITGTPDAEETSIMAYQLPGSITRDGRPVIGGSTLTALDKSFLGRLYPLSVTPPVEPPPPAARSKIVVRLTGKVTGAVVQSAPVSGLGDMKIDDLISLGGGLLKLIGLLLGGGGGSNPPAPPAQVTTLTLETDNAPGGVRVVSLV